MSAAERGRLSRDATHLRRVLGHMGLWPTDAQLWN
jgi:hypothetical protein